MYVLIRFCFFFSCSSFVFYYRNPSQELRRGEGKLFFSSPTAARPIRLDRSSHAVRRPRLHLSGLSPGSRVRLWNRQHCAQHPGACLATRISEEILGLHSWMRTFWIKAFFFSSAFTKWPSRKFEPMDIAPCSGSPRCFCSNVPCWRSSHWTFCSLSYTRAYRIIIVPCFIFLIALILIRHDVHYLLASLLIGSSLSCCKLCEDRDLACWGSLLFIVPFTHSAISTALVRDRRQDKIDEWTFNGTCIVKIF